MIPAPGVMTPSWSEQIRRWIAEKIGWLLGTVIFRVPLSGATWLGRGLIDDLLYPWLAFFTLLSLLGVLVVAQWGATTGRFLPELQAAWVVEYGAERHAADIREVLGEHDRHKPGRLYTKQDRRDYAAWRERRDELEARLEAKEVLIPSRWIPWAPAHDELRSGPAIALHQAHHFVFGSVYSWALLAYFLAGLYLGWKRSELRWNRAWRKAIVRHTGDHVLLGVGEDDKERMSPTTSTSRSAPTTSSSSAPLDQARPWPSSTWPGPTSRPAGACS